MWQCNLCILEPILAPPRHISFIDASNNECKNVKSFDLQQDEQSWWACQDIEDGMDSDIPHCKAFGNLTPAELSGPQHPKSAATHNKTGDLLLSTDIHNYAEQSDPFILAILDMLCVKTNSKVTHTHTHKYISEGRAQIFQKTQQFQHE